MPHYYTLIVVGLAHTASRHQPKTRPSRWHDQPHQVPYSPLAPAVCWAVPSVSDPTGERTATPDLPAIQRPAPLSCEIYSSYYILLSQNILSVNYLCNIITTSFYIYIFYIRFLYLDIMLHQSSNTHWNTRARFLPTTSLFHTGIFTRYTFSIDKTKIPLKELIFERHQLWGYPQSPLMWGLFVGKAVCIQHLWFIPTNVGLGIVASESLLSHRQILTNIRSIPTNVGLINRYNNCLDNSNWHPQSWEIAVKRNHSGHISPTYIY